MPLVKKPRTASASAQKSANVQETRAAPSTARTKTYSIGERHMAQAQAHLDRFKSIRQKTVIEPVKSVPYTTNLAPQQPEQPEQPAVPVKPTPEPSTGAPAEPQPASQQESAPAEEGTYTSTAITVASSPILQTLVSSVNALRADVDSMAQQIGALQTRRQELEETIADRPAVSVDPLIAQIEELSKTRTEDSGKVTEFLEEMRAMLAMAGLGQ
ncbi:hypothetical protein J8273_8371 [Carpediemonas membranifera]|uniref:Uncharacterized protein n=1 Tax=Carpediemonas membranifera TaxID=201153 RepID=A0A8J6B484_9EUKA|nr:hypothetical protein J8273_8371 [Carpediemonas membranifera]|eukprot:KAG9389697.1 hypothetical protein J8273_8371 [Carpediemonas membranifera]